jgi:hypothetical protein
MRNSGPQIKEEIFLPLSRHRVINKKSTESTLQLKTEGTRINTENISIKQVVKFASWK